MVVQRKIIRNPAFSEEASFERELESTLNRANRRASDPSDAGAFSYRLGALITDIAYGAPPNDVGGLFRLVARRRRDIGLPGRDSRLDRLSR
jgi:hypothetical protein